MAEGRADLHLLAAPVLARADLAPLQAALLPAPWKHPHDEAAHDERSLEEGGRLTPAAVLLAIVLHDEPTVLLTQRTAHLRDHAGQISFPGGRVENSDTSPIHTALREAQEEIGLDPARVEVLGFLPEYRTGTGFRVAPVVAQVQPGFALTLDTFEVAEAFEVPLSFLLNPHNVQQQSLHYRGRLRHFYAMPYGPRFIWGATAGMLVSLLRLLGHDIAPLPPAEPLADSA